MWCSNFQINLSFFLQLDAKNSPLALLAQTCSSIGKDPAPSKSSSASGGEKKESGSGHGKDVVTRPKSESPGGTSSSKPNNSGDERSRSRPLGSSINSDKKDSHGSSLRTGSKGSPPKIGFRVPQPPSKETSSGHSDKSNGSSSNNEESIHSNRMSHSSASSGSSSAGKMSSSSGGNSCSSMLLELNQELMSKNHSALSSASLHPLYNSLKLQEAIHGGLTASSLGLYPPGCGLPFLGYPLGIDPLAAAYSASLAAAQAAACSSQKSPSSSGGCPSSVSCSSSPYVNYARVKTATGGMSIVPVCKDPFCSHCQLAMHGVQMSSAPGSSSSCAASGCSQCNLHEKCSSASQIQTSLSPSSSLQAAAAITQGGLSSLFPGNGASSLALSSLCSHAFGGVGAALPHSAASLVATPYVCNWVQGTEYCGKRFTNSDELLLHLHSHTSSADALQQQLSSPYNSASGLPMSAFPFPLSSFLHSQLQGVGSLSPSPLSAAAAAAYPQRSSISPNSLLNTARYHPYKPPSLSGGVGISTSSGGILPGPFPSLAAYYSPYAIYGSRVNAAAAVGP